MLHEMPPLILQPRPENARVFFAGVLVLEACCAVGRRAARWREAGAEWVRPLIGPGDWRETWTEGEFSPRRWAIDFPPGADERALTQASELGHLFQRAGGQIVRRGPAAELRIALAKCDRYLAAPAGGLRAQWRWVPAAVLPGRGLAVVMRDDEFLAGVLGSRWLPVWLRGTGRRLGAASLRCFPLPWAPDTLRGALTREQEERRSAVVGAWRAAGGGAENLAPDDERTQNLDAAVTTAYGWPAAVRDDEALRLLFARA